MPWIKRKADVHRCPLPVPADYPDAAEGDLWRCDTCKKVWCVKEIYAGESFRPSPPEFVWRIHTLQQNDY